MTPSPGVEILQILSVVGTSAVGAVQTTPQNVFARTHPRINAVCILFERDVEVPDIVPAIQQELQRLGADSRVYAPDAAPEGCAAVLSYRASMQWDRRLFSNEYTSYMTSAELTLRANGQVVSSASYRLGLIGLDKWQSTRRKIAPVIEALMTRPQAAH